MNKQLKGKHLRHHQLMIGVVFSTSLFLFGFPSGIFGQKYDHGSFQSPNVIIKETLVQGSQSFSESDDGGIQTELNRGSRGPKQPPLNPPLSQWDIAGQTGVKIFINKTGWYRVAAPALVAAGFDINSDRTNWKLFLNARELPIRVNAEGSIEFYGLGADTPSTDANVYFLINGNDAGLRIPVSASDSGSSNPTLENFQVSVERKDRNYYLTSILNGETENWFSSIISPTASIVNIRTEKLAANGQARIRLKLQGLTLVEHLVNVKVNGQVIGTTAFSNKDFHQVEYDIPLSSLNEVNNEITIQAVGSSNDFSLLDSASLMFPRKFEAVNDRLSFLVPAGNSIRVSGFSSENIKLFEVDNQRAATQLTVQSEFSGSTYGFRLAAANIDREFIAVTDSASFSPLRTVGNLPSSWNSTSNQADFLIISPSDLSSYAQNLATLRQSQGIRTSVVSTEDLADEFGFGTLTPQALKDFFKHATLNWSRKPQYVLLFGDSSYDMRNYLGNADRNLIPTKLIDTFDMETASDGWLVDFDEDGIENVAIGRLPVGNAFEAGKAIDKIFRYESQSVTNDKSALLVADYFFEILNGALQDLLPSNVSSTKIERMSMTDFQMRQEIVSRTNQNPTFISYLGHGTTGVWSTGNVFGINDAQGLTNQKLSFYMLMTCLNGFTHNASNASLAESLVLADNGAVAVWASSGSTYASGQIEMGQEVARQIFGQGKKQNRIGSIVKTAKQSSGDWDARRTWQLIGDPTLVIK